MRATVIHGGLDVRLEEVPDPVLVEPTDAVVRVLVACICGSDLWPYRRPGPREGGPGRIGHEFVGVVEEVGPSVERLRPGDRVMVPFDVSCGSCWYCARGLLGNCHNVNANAAAVGGIYGYSHTAGGFDGGQAEYVRVPFADVGPEPIPAWLADEDALMLTDALPTGYFGAQLGDVGEGDVVVVFGAGPVGLFAARSAWFMGAGRVVVVDHVAERLAKAREFAFAETVDLGVVDDVVVHLKEATGHLGADVAIDAVGAEAVGAPLQHAAASWLKLTGGSAVALNWAIDAVRKGGTVSVVGAYGPIFVPVKFGDALNKGLTLRMNQCPVKRQWPRLLEHVRAGHLRPSDVITHRYDLEDVAEAYETFSAKRDGCIKPVLVPSP